MRHFWNGISYNLILSGFVIAHSFSPSTLRGAEQYGFVIRHFYVRDGSAAAASRCFRATQ